MTAEIKNMVERIVFDEGQLFQLKEALNQLNAKKIDLREVKQVILEQRTEIMQSLIDLFFFYLNQHQSRVSLNENGEEIKKLKIKIKEREKLLEEVGGRLQRITRD